MRQYSQDFKETGEKDADFSQENFEKVAVTLETARSSVLESVERSGHLSRKHY